MLSTVLKASGVAFYGKLSKAPDASAPLLVVFGGIVVGGFRVATTCGTT